MGLEIRGVTKSFVSTTAVDNLTFRLDVPSVVGFLGPNGAGKTTTMRMITGFLAPTTGEILVDGEKAGIDNTSLKSKIGYLPESNPLYTELEVHEYLKFAAELSGLDPARIGERLKFVVERCGLKDVLYDPIYRLSKGYRQRVGLAQAIIHDPQILILDEPTSGLDPNQVVGIRDLISELAKEKFVILSTHILSEVQALCDRVLIINKGKLVLDATIDQLQHSETAVLDVSVKTGMGAEEVADVFMKGLAPAGCSGKKSGGIVSLRIRAKDTEEFRERVFELCVSRGYKLLEMSNSASDLENVFRELTLGTNETGQE